MIRDRNAWLVVIFLCVWTLGQLQRFQLTPSLAIYGHDLVIGVFLLLNLPQLRSPLYSLINASLTYLKKHPLVVVSIGWVAVGLIGAALSDASLVRPVFYLARISYYLVFTWSVIVLKPWAKADWRCLWLLAGLFFTWLGALQYLFIPDTRLLAALGWDPHYYRLIGPVLDPGFAGMILILTFVLWQWPTIRISPRWKMVVNVLLTLAIYLTYSRASYLAFGVALLGVVMLSPRSWHQQVGKKLGYLGCGVLLALLVLLVPRPSGEGGNLTRTSTITARLDSNTQSLVKLEPYQWLLGRGLFVAAEPPQPTTGYVLPNHAQLPDNFIVTLFTGTGGVGLLLVGWWLFKGGKWLWQHDQLVLVQFAAVAVHALFNNTFLQPFIFLWLLGMVATIQGKAAAKL